MAGSFLRTAVIATVLGAAGSARARLVPVRAQVPTAHAPGPVPVTILLPPSYEREKTRRFPVLYFLHDAMGDESVLFREGVAETLKGEMVAGEIPEFLLVSPRGTGTWFVDSFDGRFQCATFLSHDLVPWVDAHFRTIPLREARAATGISMGGYGAFHWGLTSPELFAVVAGLSPAIQQLNWAAVEALPFFIRPSLKRAFGASATKNNLRENDLYDLLLSHPGLAARAPEVLVRCGTEDRYRLAELVPFFRRFLDVMGVPNELVLEHGVHDWPYWRTAFPLLVRDVLGRIRDAAGAAGGAGGGA
jgi:putative tributyrin esterase